MTLPAQVLNALRMLPQILDRVDQVAQHTAVLPRVESAIDRVADRLPIRNRG